MYSTLIVDEVSILKMISLSRQTLAKCMLITMRTFLSYKNIMRALSVGIDKLFCNAYYTFILSRKYFSTFQCIMFFDHPHADLVNGNLLVEIF